MKLDPETCRHLANLDVNDGSVAGDVLVVITEKLARAQYIKINAVLETCGGKWSRKAKAHVSTEDPRPRLDAAIDAGEITTLKELNTSMGYFETPTPLADELVRLAGVKAGDVVLEPSAGKGRIIAAALHAGATQVIACERDPGRRGFLQLVDRAHVTVLDADDFLDVDAAAIRVDAVVMNPPFCRSGKGDHLTHVRHAFAMLKPGGRLVAVLPASVTFRQDRRYALFRAEIAALRPPGTLTALPERSFAESGTLVNTVVLRMVKK